MKNFSKNLKTVATLLIIFVVIGMFPNPVSAGVVNKYLHTDILATIDGHGIKAYNIDGYTNVVAEDLANYGFEVNWDGLRRRLDISRAIYPSITGNYTAGRAPGNMVGKKAGDVYSTDIDTYVEGKYIKSYNIGGYTCVNIEDVAKILNCQTSYNDYERRLYVTRMPFPDFNTIRGVTWNTSVSHLATYRELDLQVMSATANTVKLKYRLYNEYSNETISSGTLTVPYSPGFLKYSYKKNSYSWDDIFKLSLITDKFIIPDSSGKEFGKIRIAFDENGIMHKTSTSSSPYISSSHILEQK